MQNYAPSFMYEETLAAPVVGIDEAGCGPWAGPVVAAAVHLTSDFPLEVCKLLNDSKKLTAMKRQFIFDCLCQESGKTAYIGVGEVSAADIDKLNIASATKEAMRRAVEDLPITPASFIVDGNRNPELGRPTCMLIKGDQRSFSIAAASIVAKVTRDAMMHLLDKEFPGYGWASNAGYGTKVHQEALNTKGVTPFHRQSYAPVRKLCDVSGITVSSSDKTFYDSVYKNSISQINRILCS